VVNAALPAGARNPCRESEDADADSAHGAPLRWTARIGTGATKLTSVRAVRRRRGGDGYEH
jgi:hypothetical protein